MSSITQAKAEAQKLIKRYNKLQAEAKTADAAEASRKASEAEKLVSQISALQSAITKLQAKDRQQQQTTTKPAATATESKPKPAATAAKGEQRNVLEARIARIEAAQQRTRAQIEQLSRAKQELARLKKEAAQSAEQEKRSNDEKLQQELAKLIDKKEKEQEHLKNELEAIRRQSEKDAELLKVQRDSARAMMEKQKQLEREKLLSSATAVRKGSKTLFISIIFSALIIGGFVGVLLFTPWLDEILGLQRGVVAPPPVIEEVADVEEEPVVEEPPPVPTTTIEAIREYQDRLKVGGRGPVMVELSGGSFMMGARPSQPHADEKPQHQVRLNQFSIGKYEVTFSEYDRFARNTNRQLPRDNDWGRGRRPVINVTWNDARDYASWLSEQTGRQYRLPSEREWEYAARAGTDTLYWWGYELQPDKANCASCESQFSNKQTSPVGNFPANQLGLHDVVGNVFEWVMDCRRANYRGAPEFGQTWEGGGADCSRRVARSSSFRSYTGKMRLTKREFYRPQRRTNNIGFRVVRVD